MTELNTSDPEVHQEGWKPAAGLCSPAPDRSVFRDLALKVSNDISENIDGGESRKELREAVKWWASFACDQAQRRATAEQTVEMFKMAKQLMDIAIPPNIAVSGGLPATGKTYTGRAGSQEEVR